MSGCEQSMQNDPSRTQAHMASLVHELQRVERALLDISRLTAALAGRRLVYVGGRPDSNAALRDLLLRAGGEFVHHTALIDDNGERAMRFAALLPRTDAVLCPLDTIDPESLAALRALCARHRVPWAPLRTSSVASFIAGVLREPRAQHRRAAPCICLRHG